MICSTPMRVSRAWVGYDGEPGSQALGVPDGRTTVGSAETRQTSTSGGMGWTPLDILEM